MTAERLAVVAGLALIACGGREEPKPRAVPDAKIASGPPIDAGEWAPSTTRTMKASQVAVGDGISCAIVTGGRVRCWGRNDHGEHGKGASEVQAATPVEIPMVTGATQVAVADLLAEKIGRVCALAAGKVWCWGGNPGDVNPEDHGLHEVLDGAVQLAFGANALVVMADGTVRAWGENTWNALGLGKDVDRAWSETIPGIEDAIAAASGDAHGCVIRRGGTVQCWGYVGVEMAPTVVPGAVGATAIATERHGRDTCAIISGGMVTCWDQRLQPAVVDGLRGIVSISAGARFCAVADNGAVTCWGSDEPRRWIVGVTEVTQIAVGDTTTCATRRDGTVACWGDNRHGQLGDGTLIDRADPVAVASLDYDRMPPPVDGAAEVASLPPQEWDGLPAACAHGPLEGSFKTLQGPIPQVSGYGITLRGDSDVILYLGSVPLPAEVNALMEIAPRGHELVIRATIMLERHVPYELRSLTMIAHDRAPDLTSFYQDSLVKVTHVDDTWICGELHLESSPAQPQHADLSGRFAARRLDAE